MLLSRRILRIKVLQALYSHFKSGKSVAESEKELLFSIEKSYELFYYLLQLVLDIADYAESRIELSMQKKQPTWEDLNPNRRFVDNPVFQIIKSNAFYIHYTNNKKISWINHPELIKNLYHEMIDFPLYQEYMKKKEENFEEDKKIVIEIFNQLVLNHEPLFNTLEEQSIFWNSEIDFITSIIVKAIKAFKKDQDSRSSLYSEENKAEDMDYMKKLFRKTVANYDEYSKVIDEYTRNWDVERIAFMDVLIMQLAINEIVEFSEIPKKVSMNEYIDISKEFSTKNSAQFINGVLDKIVIKLSKEKKIVKQGKGLIGEL